MSGENKQPFSFAERLQQLIDSKGYTRAELANIAKVDRANITNYLKGTYQAKQGVIYAIAKHTNVSEAWLMGYDVPMERQYTGGLTISQVEAWIENSSTPEEAAEIAVTIAKRLTHEGKIKMLQSLVAELNE